MEESDNEDDIHSSELEELMEDLEMEEDIDSDSSKGWNTNVSMVKDILNKVSATRI